MIPIWLNRKASLPVSEQLVAQLLLGIFSGGISPGDRLPSVRSFARRLGIHPNTISHAYRKLAVAGWIETKRGKGAYATGPVPSANLTLDEYARLTLRRAAELGFHADNLIATLQRLTGPALPKIVVSDPDIELARILAAEISEALGCPIAAAPWTTPEANVMTVISTRQQPLFQKQWPNCLFEAIHIRSIADILAGAPPLMEGSLVAFVSRSRVLAGWAHILAEALGVHRDAILFRDPSQPRWQAGLKSCTLIAADIVAANDLLPSPKLFLIRLLAPSSVFNLRALTTT